MVSYVHNTHEMKYNGRLKNMSLKEESSVSLISFV